VKEEIAVENLREIKGILDKINIDYWLDMGTLLGAVRDGKIIEWDHDVDLATWYGNTKQIISAFPEFRKKGFYVFLGTKRNSIVVTRSGCKADVYLYRKTDGYAWLVWIVREKKLEKVLHSYMAILTRKSHAKPEGRFVRRTLMRFSPLLPLMLKEFLSYIMSLLDRHAVYYSNRSVIPVTVPKHYFEKLSIIEFYGMKFNTPSDIEKYLEYRYGSDWKIPIKKWIWYKDDGAVNLNWIGKKSSKNMSIRQV